MALVFLPRNKSIGLFYLCSAFVFYLAFVKYSTAKKCAIMGSAVGFDINLFLGWLGGNEPDASGTLY